MNNSVKAAMLFLLGSMVWLVFYMTILKPNNTPVIEETNTNQLLVENQKLKSENDSLIAELGQTNQLFDRKEEKYIKVIARYEYGIDWVKSYHRNVYEEFHRILAFKETYSREAEVQTKKELKDY
jgi:hypothetical protein